MLKRKRIMCLMLPLIFITPSTVTPFPEAKQLIDSKINSNEMVLKTDKFGLIINPIQEQFEKDKIEFEQKKAEELKLQKEKEIEEQKKSIKENHKQTFILTYYGATKKECGNQKFITASGVPVREGHIAVPKEIPFGSKVIINKNEYIATDRGNPKYICMLNDGSIRVDIFIPRLDSEINDDDKYEKRIASLGTQKVVGELYIKE